MSISCAQYSIVGIEGCSNFWKGVLSQSAIRSKYHHLSFLNKRIPKSGLGVTKNQVPNNKLSFSKSNTKKYQNKLFGTFWAHIQWQLNDAHHDKNGKEYLGTKYLTTKTGEVVRNRPSRYQLSSSQKSSLYSASTRLVLVVHGHSWKQQHKFMAVCVGT